MNRGTLGFVDETAIRVPAGTTDRAQVLAEDVDGDGASDLVLTSGLETVADVVLLNDGNGMFGVAMPLPVAQATTSGVVVRDFDRDGHADIVRSIGSNGHVNSTGLDSLLIGDGTGQFTENMRFSTAPWNTQVVPTTGVHAFDANGDGYLDLLFLRADSFTFTGTYGARNSLVLGNGDGTFAESAGALPDVDDNSYGAHATDLDGDGDLDVVVCNTVIGLGASQSADVLINQGGGQGGTPGVFLERIDAIEESPSTAEGLRLGVVAGDLTGDGHDDVLFLVHDLPPGGSQPVYVARPSSADFDRLSSFETGTFIASGGVFADLDGDQDLDVVITAAGSAAGGQNSGAVKVWMNRTR